MLKTLLEVVHHADDDDGARYAQEYQQYLKTLIDSLVHLFILSFLVRLSYSDYAFVRFEVDLRHTY